MTAKNKRYGMVMDLDLCVGCRGCEVACRQENDLKPRIGEPLNLKTQRIPHLTKVETIGPYGTFPDVDMFFFPKLCNHCEQAPCVTACPTGAMTQREDGIVTIARKRCISCLNCLDACPFQAIFYDKEDDTLSKCHLCAHRIDHELEPACVSTCMTRCRVFGDLNDPDSAPSRLLREKEDAIMPLPVPWGSPAQPRVFYIRSRRPTRGTADR